MATPAWSHIGSGEKFIQLQKPAEFLCKDRQLLLPLVELITDTEMALDELIDVAGRAAIEAVLTLSAQELAGPSIRARRPASTWQTKLNRTSNTVATPFQGIAILLSSATLQKGGLYPSATYVSSKIATHVH